MLNDSVIFSLTGRRAPKGEAADYPESIVDQCFLSVAQQVERFGIGCGNLPSSSLYDSDETCLSDETVVSHYGLSDPVDIKLMQNVVDAKVDSHKAKANKENNKSSENITNTKGEAEASTAVVEGSGE